MRQRRLLEYLKDFNLTHSYHPGKANVVADTLSRKSLHIFTLMVRELDLVKQFRDLSLVWEVNPKSVSLGILKIASSLLDEIWVEAITQGKASCFEIWADGVVSLQGRNEVDPKNLSVHIAATKMYQDLKRMFWWPSMKKDVIEFEYVCLVCQKDKIETIKILATLAYS
ncbi:hypothetical protein CR513_06767, partial [Mucuna pruriens]